MRVEWDEKHNLNVKEIDDQHRYFIEVINHMFEALEGKGVEPIVDSTLTDLQFYAKEHFATEEKYMELIDYKDIAVQKEEHAKLLTKVDELLAERDAANDLYNYYFNLLYFLTDWLTDHLETHDVKLGPVLNAAGYF